ncbi:hypothetical protein CAPI_01290 [Corynebacterium capitovis DSM 44611]|uniref:DUF3068 domain-containing protein n=1 Tax=Corynebacterium capitovis TaxID=131081 RepID=UPI00036697D7|nr:DUF3068 domain-containing protein [Corynebacterium capitovis]WKD56832.1 hypothetical protein CAPI_01290 [Corynebacterium capitovis DSM 44611]
MPSLSRLFPAIMAGLGVALLSAGVLAPRLLLGDARLPLGLTETTWTISDAEGSYNGETVPVTHQLHMHIQEPADTDSASIRVGDTLRAGEAGQDFDNLVSASTWSFAMDRRSGQPEGTLKLQSVMTMPETEVPTEGVAMHWFKLPSNTGREEYQIFDPVLRTTAPATFAGEEHIAGRTVYRFEQTVQPTNVARLYADTRNTKTLERPVDPEDPEGEKTQIRSFRFHSAQREFLVDQVSGLVVGINENVDDYYGDAQGAKLEQIISYSGTMSSEQTEGMVKQLKSVYSASQSRALTYGVIGVGALMTLIGCLLALWPVLTRRRRAGSLPD